MFDTNLIFWNVDTQVDFVEPEGKLYVKSAELLKPVWQKITDLATVKNIKVVNTADFHYPNSAELSTNPDFVSTFPEHCMANTPGAEYVAETIPEDPAVFDWDKQYLTLDEVNTKRNIILRKDAFDVFVGNPHTKSIVEILAPSTVVVYGVTTNVCVAAAVAGLASRVKKVVVVKDAIKELPSIPLPFDDWKKWGVEMITYEELKELV